MTDTNIKYTIQRAKTMADIGLGMIFQWPDDMKFDNNELTWRLHVLLESITHELGKAEAAIKE